VDRGERLIKLGDSWFSAKSIEVECYTYKSFRGRVRDELGHIFVIWLNVTATPNTKKVGIAIRL